MSDLGDALNAAKVTPEEFGEALDETGIPWRRERRPPTVGEARAYFDAHVNGGGDPEVMAECERVLDATGHTRSPTPGPEGGGTEQSPFPHPSEEQLEEEGSD